MGTLTAPASSVQEEEAEGPRALGRRRRREGVREKNRFWVRIGSQKTFFILEISRRDCVLRVQFAGIFSQVSDCANITPALR